MTVIWDGSGSLVSGRLNPANQAPLTFRAVVTGDAAQLQLLGVTSLKHVSMAT